MNDEYRTPKGRKGLIRDIERHLLDCDLGPSVDPAWEHNALFFIADFIEEREKSLRARLAVYEHDALAYRLALGYEIPGGHDGRLSDGTLPINGLAEASRNHMRAKRRLLNGGE